MRRWYIFILKSRRANDTNNVAISSRVSLSLVFWTQSSGKEQDYRKWDISSKQEVHHRRGCYLNGGLLLAISHVFSWDQATLFGMYTCYLAVVNQDVSYFKVNATSSPLDHTDLGVGGKSFLFLRGRDRQTDTPLSKFFAAIPKWGSEFQKWA